jgi:hypothetical protein
MQNVTDYFRRANGCDSSSVYEEVCATFLQIFYAEFKSCFNIAFPSERNIFLAGSFPKK